MQVKTFEVRDVGTFIPILAVKLDGMPPHKNRGDEYLLSRAGFGRTATEQAEYVVVWPMHGGCGKATCDLYDHGSATLTRAHHYLNDHFDELESGSVIDIEFITGAVKRPKISERLV